MNGANAERADRERRLTVLTLFLCSALFLFHLALIWHYAVDVPFWDEWSEFGPDQLPAGWSLRSVTSQHLEHRFAMANVLIRLQYAWNGWDVAVHQRLNFLLFGVLLISIAGFVRKTIPETPLWVVLAFLLFVLSPINWMNHFMAYQTSTHLYVMLVLLAAWLLFDAFATKVRLLLGGCVAAALVFTSAAGTAATVALAIGFVTFEMRGFARPRDSQPETAARFAAAVLPMAVALALWSNGYRHEATFPALTPPTSWAYWDHFLGLVGLGFGFQLHVPLIGAVCILAVLGPLIAPAMSRGVAPARGAWTPLAAALALLAGAAAVSLGRASFGFAQAKSPRYAEYVLPLVPLTAAAWYRWFALRGSRPLTAVAVLWLVCFSSFANDWRSFRFYGREALRRNSGVTCIEEYYRGVSDGICPTIYPADFPGGLASFLDSAKELNASFYRKMVARGARSREADPMFPSEPASASFQP